MIVFRASGTSGPKDAENKVPLSMGGHGKVLLIIVDLIILENTSSVNLKVMTQCAY